MLDAARSFPDLAEPRGLGEGMAKTDGRIASSRKLITMRMVTSWTRPAGAERFLRQVQRWVRPRCPERVSSRPDAMMEE
jgi:hypothetical protein